MEIMERNMTAERFIGLLRDRIESESGRAIVLKMVASMSEDNAKALADECEDLVRFREYLSEDEALEIVRNFVNFDGSRGGHWEDPDETFRVLESLGIRYEEEGEYNRWAFYAVMNMVWSDEWGILHNYIAQDQEPRVCAELAQARLEDRDKVFSVRKYFSL